VTPALRQYAELLLDWNRTVNLTGARTLDQVERQIADAAALRAVAWHGIGHVIDIGSGGGLPAVPLALALPEVRFSLLEANMRKCAFLEQVAARLGLPNVEILPGRAEDLGRQPRLRERFNRAISRAAAPPSVLLELALPFVKPGGELIAEVTSVDAHLLESAARLLGGGTPRLERPVPGGSTLLVVPKVTSTPAAYPRRVGVPSRKPLA